ncbi:hypothetical protein DFH28DRAFT_1130605 [Melampsora americana]|nr:hypothetical protein DFH28DRAFT_1130605 [Melampsora americana]
MDDTCRHSQPPQLRQTSSHQENHMNQACEEQQQPQPIMENNSAPGDYYQYHQPQEPYPEAPPRPQEFEYEAHHQDGFQSNGYQMPHQGPPQNDQQSQYPHHDQMRAQYEESLGQYGPPAQSTCPPAGPYENFQPNPTMMYPTEQPFITYINLEGERHEVRGLISELVSWGVTAGYLIDVGISKDLVFGTFEELGYRITNYTNYIENPNEGCLDVEIIKPKESTNLRNHHTEDVDGVDVRSLRESSIGFLLDQHTPPSQSPLIPNEVIKEKVDQKPITHPPITEKTVTNHSIQPASLSIRDELVESETVRKAQRQAFRLALSKKSAEREKDGNRSSESNEENGLLSPIVSTTTIDSFIGPKEIEEEEEEERGRKKGKGKGKGKERWVEILKGDDLFSK